MLTTNDVAKVYDTILSIPGMSETVKIDLRISRKNALLLNQVIVRGLVTKHNDKPTGLLFNISNESLEELKELADHLLQKAGLIEFSGKLAMLSDEKQIK